MVTQSTPTILARATIKAFARPFKANYADPVDTHAEAARDRALRFFLAGQVQEFLNWLQSRDSHWVELSPTAQLCKGIAHIYLWMAKLANTVSPATESHLRALDIWQRRPIDSILSEEDRSEALATVHVNLALASRFQGDLKEAWKQLASARELSLSCSAQWVNSLCLASLGKDSERLNDIVQDMGSSYPAWVIDHQVCDSLRADQELEFFRGTATYRDVLVDMVPTRTSKEEVSYKVPL